MLINYKAEDGTYSISGTDDEVRKLQEKIKRINKDPEKFKARPESEKEGIELQENQTCISWTIDLGKHTDLSDSVLEKYAERIAKNRNLLADVFDYVDSDTLAENIDDYVKDEVVKQYFGNCLYTDLPVTVQTAIEDYISDGQVPVAELVDFEDLISNLSYDIDSCHSDSIAAILDKIRITRYMDFGEMLDKYMDELGKGRFDDIFAKCVTPEDAYKALEKRNKSEVAKELNIDVRDLNPDKIDVVKKLKISIFDVIKSWMK